MVVTAVAEQRPEGGQPARNCRVVPQGRCHRAPGLGVGAALPFPGRGRPTPHYPTCPGARRSMPLGASTWSLPSAESTNKACRLKPRHPSGQVSAPAFSARRLLWRQLVSTPAKGLCQEPRPGPGPHVGQDATICTGVGAALVELPADTGQSSVTAAQGAGRGAPGIP